MNFVVVYNNTKAILPEMHPFVKAYVLKIL